LSVTYVLTAYISAWNTTVYYSVLKLCFSVVLYHAHTPCQLPLAFDSMSACSYNTDLGPHCCNWVYSQFQCIKMWWMKSEGDLRRSNRSCSVIPKMPIHTICQVQ